MKSLAKKEERSALWKHCKEKHHSENECYRFLLQRHHVEADIRGCSDRSSTRRVVDELEERVELFARSMRGSRTGPREVEYTMLAHMTLANMQPFLVHLT